MRRHLALFAVLSLTVARLLAQTLLLDRAIAVEVFVTQGEGHQGDALWARI